MPEPGPSLKTVASEETRVGGDADRRLNRKVEASGPEPEKLQGPESKHPREIGGRDGLEPTRYGDWEYKGRCIDF